MEMNNSLRTSIILECVAVCGTTESVKTVIFLSTSVGSYGTAKTDVGSIDVGSILAVIQETTLSPIDRSGVFRQMVTT
jgi:hypothetical protein